MLLGRAPGHPGVDLPAGADVGLLDVGVSVRAGVPVGGTTMSVTAEYSADPPALPGGARRIADTLLAPNRTGKV